jgi:hypothetical protein
MLSYNISGGYWSIAGNSAQVWSSATNGLVSITSTPYAAWLAAGNTPTNIDSVNAAMGVVIRETGLLDDSDTTMHRIAEAVSLGLNTWTGTDVVAWVNWRRALRAIIDGSDSSSVSIPSRPSYPAGT